LSFLLINGYDGYVNLYVHDDGVHVHVHDHGHDCGFLLFYAN